MRSRIFSKVFEKLCDNFLSMFNNLQIKTPQSIDALKDIVTSCEKLLVLGARTSTVLPFSHQQSLKETFQGHILIETSALPKSMELVDEEVIVRGPISWSELRSFLKVNGRDVRCCPTDESAYVLAGISTSATGERFYSQGGVRDSVVELDILLATGERRDFRDTETLNFDQYKKLTLNYDNFKNAPFPVFQREVDYFIGTEGQLGIVLGARLKTIENRETKYILFPIESWIESDELIFWHHQLSRNRHDIYSFEFFDQASISFIGNSSLEKRDYIVIEVECEDIVEPLIKDKLHEALVLSREQLHHLRVNIPRAINEYLSANNLIKRGTDAQVQSESLREMIDFYRSWTKMGLKVLLFGHLGDCHLHFNFLLSRENQKRCDQALDMFYDFIRDVRGSPFAEHGIGTIKQDYMSRFYDPVVKEVFKKLKDRFDPDRKLNPLGFMR